MGSKHLRINLEFLGIAVIVCGGLWCCDAIKLTHTVIQRPGVTVYAYPCEPLHDSGTLFQVAIYDGTPLADVRVGIYNESGAIQFLIDENGQALVPPVGRPKTFFVHFGDGGRDHVEWQYDNDTDLIFVVIGS